MQLAARPEFMWAAMLQAQRLRKRNVETCVAVYRPATFVRPQLQREFGVEFGVPLYSTWGASEAIGSVTYLLQPGPIVALLLVLKCA